MLQQDEYHEELQHRRFIHDINDDYEELMKRQGVKLSQMDFQTRLEEAAQSLIMAATQYRLNREDELLVPRVSDILRELGELSKLPRERWPQRLLVLDENVFDALLGSFPFADVSYTPVDFDDDGRAAEIPGMRPAFVPPAEEQQRQDLKHVLKQSPSGFVRPTMMLGFAEMLCCRADAESLAGIVQDMIGLLLEMPNLRALTADIARQWASVSTSVFSRVLPTDFAKLADCMEDDCDLAPVTFLRFVACNAGLVFRELRAEPSTVINAIRLVAETTERILKAGNLAERRKGFTKLAERDSGAFLNALQQIIDRIELQYNKADNPTGLGRRTTRAYAAPAIWRLIKDVLDRIWPEEMGSLSKATSPLVVSIVFETFNRGELEFECFASPEAKRKASINNGIGNPGKMARGARDLIVDHVRHAASQRHMRYQLNSTREHLVEKLHKVRKKLGVNHLTSLKLDATIRVLALWQGEIEWRLLHGPLEKEQRRKSSISFPPFPQLGPALSIEDRVRKIVGKAQTLIDDMLATMTAPSSKGAIPAATDEGVPVDSVD